MADVFISYARSDKKKALELYNFLMNEGVSIWIDDKNLLPGQEWKLEIEKAILESKIFIACISNNSVNKRGFVQSELKKALEVADTIPQGDIFIIPVRLDGCEVPHSLSKYQWVDYFEPDEQEKLIKGIQLQLKKDTLLRNQPTRYSHDSNEGLVKNAGIVPFPFEKSLQNLKRYLAPLRNKHPARERFSILSNILKEEWQKGEDKGNIQPIIKELEEFSQSLGGPGVFDDLLVFADNNFVSYIEPFGSPIPAENYWAIIIGVGEYEDGAYGILPRADNDAHQIAELLLKSKYYDKECMRLLSTSSPKDDLLMDI